MNVEVEFLFKAMYLPIVQKKHRLIGKDFLGVAFHLMDELKKQNSDPLCIEDAAMTMVQTFNDMLNPKLSQEDMDNMINSLVHGGIFVRMVAENAYQELQDGGYL